MSELTYYTEIPPPGTIVYAAVEEIDEYGIDDVIDTAMVIIRDAKTDKLYACELSTEVRYEKQYGYVAFILSCHTLPESKDSHDRRLYRTQQDAIDASLQDAREYAARVTQKAREATLRFSRKENQ